MTWEEAHKSLTSPANSWPIGCDFQDAVWLAALAEQVEANRLAIEELRRSIQSIDSRTTGTTMIGGGE